MSLVTGRGWIPDCQTGPFVVRDSFAIKTPYKGVWGDAQKESIIGALMPYAIVRGVWVP